MSRPFENLLRVVYPDQCAACEALTDAPHGLCGSCWRDTPFLFGHQCCKCGSPLPGGNEDDDVPCDDCLALPRPWSRGFAAMAYEGKARSLILKLKHSDRTDLARPAAHWLADRLSGKLDPKTLVVPVPIHPVRLLHRRYNQAALIARGVARQLDLPLEVNALLRKKATQTLDDLTVVERFAILAGAISANPKVDFTGAKVVVIDDVMTSGATLSAAADALYRAGAQDVCVAVLARVLKAP